MVRVGVLRGSDKDASLRCCYSKGCFVEVLQRGSCTECFIGVLLERSGGEYFVEKLLRSDRKCLVEVLKRRSGRRCFVDVFPKVFCRR